MTGFFVTFGYSHLDNSGRTLFNRYFLIPEEDEDEARERICALRKQKWGFIYPIDKLASQIEKFGLTEVTEMELRETDEA